MTDLLLPEGTRPTNLHLTPMHWDAEGGAMVGHRARFVTADMYNICERIREISPALYLLELEQRTVEGERFGYAIMERCDDGVDRLVFRTSRDRLDDKVLEKLRYLMAVDLHTRLKILDDERKKLEADAHDAELESLFDRIGGPMHRELVRNGFTQGDFPTSYRLMNRAARRAGRRMR